MKELWIILGAAIVLAYLDQHVYVRRSGLFQIDRKCSVYFIMMVLLLGGYLGLRYAYNDTQVYLHLYNHTAAFPAFWETFDSSLVSDPGFNLVNGLLKTLGFSKQNFLMFYSIVTIGLYIRFLRKFCSSYPLTIFLFFAVGIFTFSGAAMKQSIATAIALNALSLIPKRKYISYILIILIASLFHVYALVFLLALFLTFRPWSGWTYLFILAVCAASVMMRPILDGIISITSAIGENYTISEFSQSGVNIFRVLVCNVPTFLSFIYRRSLFQNSTKMQNLLVNLSMMNGAIMFIGQFATANYFARLANFFVLAQAVVLPWIIGKLFRTDRKFFTVFMVLGYLFYFYYSTNIVYGTFSQNFFRISVWDYLTTFLN